MTKSINFTIIVSIASGLNANAAPTSLLTLDNQNQDMGYLLESSKTLSAAELARLKSVLMQQNLKLVTKKPVLNLEELKAKHLTPEHQNNTSDLMDLLKKHVGIDAKVSIVDLSSMVSSTQESLTSN